MLNPLATLARSVNSVSPHSAMWGLHLLTRAGSPVGKLSAGLWDGRFNFTRSSDAIAHETTEGQNPLEQRGDETTEFSITVTAHALAGLNPIAVYKSWCRDLGKSYYFFLGLLPVSRHLFILQNVNFRFRGRDCDKDGAPMIGEITLTFADDTVLGRVGKTVKDEDAKKGKSGIKKAAKTALNKADSASIWAQVEKTYASQQK